MLRKLISLCQGRLVPAGAHTPLLSFPKTAALILEFRRHAASTLWHPLAKFLSARKFFPRARHGDGDLHRAMMRNAPDGIFVVDGNLQFVEANETFCRMWGLRRQEVLALSLPELFAEANCEQDFFSDLLAHTPAQGEVTIASRTGALHIIEVKTAALPGDHYLGFARDVTAKRQYENELRRTAEWRAMLMRSFHEGLALIDCDGRILLCNRSFEVALGLSATQLQAISLLMPLRENAHASHAWSLCNASGATVYGAENPFYRALRGRERVHECRLRVLPQRKTLAVSAVPLYDEHNQLLGAAVTLRDVTAKAAKERERQTRFFLQQQTRCLAAQRRLAQDVVRRIENPLSGIALYAELLRNDLSTAGERAVLVHGILQEAKGLGETLRDLRALAHAVRSGVTITRVDEEEAAFAVANHMSEMAELPSDVN